MVSSHLLKSAIVVQSSHRQTDKWLDMSVFQLNFIPNNNWKTRFYLQFLLTHWSTLTLQNAIWEDSLKFFLSQKYANIIAQTYG